jgi:hypothetical protein
MPGCVPSEPTDGRLKASLNFDADTVFWNCEHSEFVKYHFAGLDPVVIFKDSVDNLSFRPDKFTRFINVVLGDPYSIAGYFVRQSNL